MESGSCQAAQSNSAHQLRVRSGEHSERRGHCQGIWASWKQPALLQNQDKLKIPQEEASSLLLAGEQS